MTHDSAPLVRLGPGGDFTRDIPAQTPALNEDRFLATWAKRLRVEFGACKAAARAHGISAPDFLANAIEEAQR